MSCPVEAQLFTRNACMAGGKSAAAQACTSGREEDYEHEAE